MQKKTWHWTYSVIIVGFFGVQFIGMFIGGLILGETIEVFKWLGIFIASGFLIPIKLWKKWLKTSKVEVILFLAIGVGPCLFSLFLLLNHLMVVESKTEHCKIKSAQIDPESTILKQEIKFNSSCSFFEKYPDAQKIPIEDYGNKPLNAKAVDIEIEKGIMGFWVLKDRVFYY